MQIEKYIDDKTMDRANAPITTDKGLERAVELLTRLKGTLSQVEEEKERITKPLNEALKAERSRWKPVEEAITSCIANLRARVGAYQTAKVEAQRVKETTIAARVADGKISIEEASDKMALVPKAAERVSAPSGSVSFREEERFEVMDVTMLPHEYVLANETAIRAAMKQGRRLPGVRYYKEMVPVARRG